MEYADDLARTVTLSRARLRAISEESAEIRPAPDKWSAKEIIGHLIDSASTNHQRFVRAIWQDDLIFPGYEQNAWVTAQGYQDADWFELIDLWALFNRHIASVMERIPEPVRMRSHTQHNLHERAWQTIPADQPATLDYFMRDYVGHLHHHLRQLDAIFSPPSA
jgi:hypothetical protein